MSQIRKLNYVDSKLGAPSDGQQTTRIIFNTIENPGAAVNNLTFFKNFQGLSPGQSNLPNGNRLDSMESMVIKSVMFFNLRTDGSLVFFGNRTPQTFSIIVGNQKVVKDLPIHFNQGSNGQSYDRLHAFTGTPVNAGTNPEVSPTIQNVLPCEIRLLTDIVIPPQVAFEVTVNSFATDYQATGAVVCVLSGYGKIFSAGNTF